jgi:ribose transport system ATP-binding protein
MSNYILTLEGIKKSFSGVKVLDDVDFRLRKGTVHALVGGNGAGKSTLMKILIGVYSRDAGVIKINGIETDIEDYNISRKKGISLIFQELSLVPDLTVAENIFLNREIKKGFVRNKRKMNKRAKDILSDLGIDIDVNKKIRSLSVGCCQLVEIAKALSVDSSILVMDEPTASLTEKETDILFHIIERLKQKGVSIIYISHRMSEIFKVSDEISVLRDGKMVVTEKTDNLDMKKLIDYMIGTTVEKAMEWEERTVPVGEEIILQADHLVLGNTLKDISFSVKKGEVLGFAGLMGSGRTETVETLFGLRKPSSGQIIFEGKQIKYQNNRQAIEDGIALVSEDRRRQGLIVEHTVKDNVVLPSLSRLTSFGVLIPQRLKDMANKAVEELDIKTDGINTRVSNLSGGNQQKVVISKWLRRAPKVLLMDEPTAGVDVGAKAEIVNIVRKLAEQQKTVIFISSEISEMLAVCDRIIVLRDGEITGEFNHDEIKSEEALQHAIQN